MTRRPPNGVESCRAPGRGSCSRPWSSPAAPPPSCSAPPSSSPPPSPRSPSPPPPRPRARCTGWTSPGGSTTSTGSQRWAHGARFAYVKATEGTGYRNPYFTQQYDGSFGSGCCAGRTTSHARTSAPARRRPTTSPPTAAAGPRRQDPARSARHRVEPLSRRDVLRAVQDADGGVDPVLQQAVPRPHDPLAGDLHGVRVVVAVCGPGRRLQRHQPAVGRPVQLQPRVPAVRVGLHTWWQTADHGVFPGDQDQFNGGNRQLQRMANG